MLFFSPLFSFNKYLLSSYHVPRIAFGTEDPALKKIDKVLVLSSLGKTKGSMVARNALRQRVNNRCWGGRLYNANTKLQTKHTHKINQRAYLSSVFWPSKLKLNLDHNIFTGK